MNAVIVTHFDIQIGLSHIHDKPLEFYCKMGDTHALAQIHFVNNLYSHIRFSPLPELHFLDEEDRTRCSELLEQNLPFVIQMWCNFHLYNKSIESIEIKNKL